MVLARQRAVPSKFRPPVHQYMMHPLQFGARKVRYLSPPRLGQPLWHRPAKGPLTERYITSALAKGSLPGRCAMECGGSRSPVRTIKRSPGPLVVGCTLGNRYFLCLVLPLPTEYGYPVSIVLTSHQHHLTPIHRYQQPSGADSPTTRRPRRREGHTLARSGSHTDERPAGEPAGEPVSRGMAGPLVGVQRRALSHDP
jgi:hypothetical protein